MTTMQLAMVKAGIKPIKLSVARRPSWPRVTKRHPSTIYVDVTSGKEVKL